MSDSLAQQKAEERLARALTQWDEKPFDQEAKAEACGALEELLQLQTPEEFEKLRLHELELLSKWVKSEPHSAKDEDELVRGFAHAVLFAAEDERMAHAVLALAEKTAVVAEKYGSDPAPFLALQFTPGLSQAAYLHIQRLLVKIKAAKLVAEEQIDGAKLPGMPWKEVKAKAEAYLRGTGAVIGRNALAGIIGCSPATLSKAIKKSSYLNARMAELKAQRESRLTTPLSNMVLEQQAQTTEQVPGESTLEELVAEQEADQTREERQTLASRRGKKR